MNRPFWRAFILTAAILTVLLSAALWKALQAEIDPPRPLDVQPAPAKS